MPVERAHRETAMVDMWLNNDKELQTVLRRIARTSAAEYNFQVDDEIRRWVEGMIVPDEATLATDLLYLTLARVDWTAICEAARKDD